MTLLEFAPRYILVFCMLFTTCNGFPNLETWHILNMSTVPLWELISGYDNETDKIWLIYGFIPPLETPWVYSRIAYHMDPMTLSLTASTQLTFDARVDGQSYVTYGPLIYFLNAVQEAQHVWTFNMRTEQTTQIATRSPFSKDPCVTICPNSNILHIIGGFGNGVTTDGYTQRLDLISTSWLSSLPSDLNKPRYGHSCECVDDTLWIFGGIHVYDDPTDSVENYALSGSSWVELVDTLSIPVVWTRSTVIAHLIFCIGGSGVDIIDTATKQTTAGPPMYFGRANGAVLYVPTVQQIFLIGGYGWDNYGWEVSNVLTDTTNHPTNDPTNHPSLDPTNNPSLAPTNNPTNDPSRYPTVAPTNNPTNDPTNDPTRYPTSAPLASSAIDKGWIQKESLNCPSGFTDVPQTNVHYNSYCKQCPSGTAGTFGQCEKCGTLEEPNHGRTECEFVNPWWLWLIEIVLGSGLLGVLGASVVYMWKKTHPVEKNKESESMNDGRSSTEMRTLTRVTKDISD
eukprot:178719_1